MWAVVKYGVIGCKICVKKGIYWSIDGQMISADTCECPLGFFPLQVWLATQELLMGLIRPLGRRLPTPDIGNEIQIE